MFCVILNVFAHPDVMEAGCPSGSSSTTSRGSCLPFLTIIAAIRGQPPPTGESCLPDQSGQAPSLSGYPSGRPSSLEGILHPGHRQGAHVSLLSAAVSLTSESKLQGEIDRCDYSYYQLFRCSFWVCFYIAVYRLKY